MVNPKDGFYYGDGTIDPTTEGPAMWIDGPDATGHYVWVFEAGLAFQQRIEHGKFDANVGYSTTFSTGIGIHAATVTAGAVTLSSGNGAPTIGGNVGDMYIRKDGGDGSWIYRCTVAGAAGAATWVAKL